MATTVTYKGNQLVSFDSGTKTLETAGKYCEDDITVTSTGGDPYQKWKNYIGSRTVWDRLFSYSYGALTYNDLVALNLSSSANNVTSMEYMFDRCHITQIPAFDTSTITNMNYAFNACSQLTTLGAIDTSNVTTFTYTFSNCGRLEIIPYLDTSRVTRFNNTFNGCSLLENITFRPNRIRADITFSASRYLTNASLVSIANGLSEDAVDHYLTLHSNLSANGGILDTTTGTYETVYEEYDNYDIFTADETTVQGNTTLRQFITQIKGWGIV